MKFVTKILTEQFLNLALIFRMCIYDLKGKYQMHYLGLLWEFITPAFKVLIYWFVFGLGIRGGEPVNGTPYIVWLLIGLIPWFFISPSVIQGTNSIYAKMNLVSKMKFPVSVLPTISIFSNALNFLIMLVLLGIVLLINQINPGIYLLQFPYYLLCLFVFLFSCVLLGSTISIIIRDFQLMLQSGMRLLFFFTPVLWDPSNLDKVYQTILKLNPFNYLIEGFRTTFLGQEWFFYDWVYTLYFWAITLFILFIGAFLHIKFRDKFIDYL